MHCAGGDAGDRFLYDHGLRHRGVDGTLQGSSEPCGVDPRSRLAGTTRTRRLRRACVSGASLRRCDRASAWQGVSRPAAYPTTFGSRSAADGRAGGHAPSSNSLRRRVLPLARSRRPDAGTGRAGDCARRHRRRSTSPSANGMAEFKDHRVGRRPVESARGAGRRRIEDIPASSCAPTRARRTYDCERTGAGGRGRSRLNRKAVLLCD